jgi:threonine/homoserine/homoserine lactone efflux protein
LASRCPGDQQRHLRDERTNVTGIKSGALSWTLLGLIGLAVLILLSAAVAHFVAWIGAVLNTAQLPDKTVVVLLVVGLLGLVFIATIAYVIAARTASKPRRRRAHRRRLEAVRQVARRP